MVYADLPPGQQPLDWSTRINILLGAAKGLKYLHSRVPPVINRDVKCENILLGEGYHPKLSDFGLARLGPTGDNTHVSTRVMDTHGYCAPEYLMTGKLTVSTDIYSFGVVMLEVLTGRIARDENLPEPNRDLALWVNHFFLFSYFYTCFSSLLFNKAPSSKNLLLLSASIILC